MKSPKEKNIEGFVVNQMSVVLVGQILAPSRLNPDFLKLSKVIPDNWQVEENLTTPVISNVKFKNRIFIRAEPEKIVIETPSINDGFKAPSSIYNLAKRLFAASQTATCAGLGLNCNVLWRHQTPELWLATAFLKPGKWQNQGKKLKAANIKMVFDYGFAELHASLNPIIAKNRFTNEEMRAVQFDFNFHHPGPLNSSQVNKVVGTWPKRQADIVSLMNALVKQS